MAILTVLSDAELDAFVASYDVGRRLSSRGIEAGTVNTSYALDLEDGRFFLRLYEQQDHAGALRDVALALHLARAGVPTPEPRRASDGAHVRTLRGRPAALFPWVEGEMSCQHAVTKEAAWAVGAALARVHLAGPPPGAPFGEGRFGPADLEAACARVAASADAEAATMAESLRRAVRDAAAARSASLPRGLVHGDLFRDNVLFAPRRRSEVAALLDFESAHEGPLLYDVAVTLLAWSFSDAFLPEIARALVAGYKAVRPVSREEIDGLHAEAVFATVRFTITRIADDTARIGKRWQRFVLRRQALEQIGPRGLAELVDS